MSTIRKRGDKYRCEVYKNGVRRSKTFRTKAEAVLWGAEEERKIELQAEGKQPETLFSEVIERYINEVTITKRGARNERLRLNRFLKHPIANKYISDVRREDIEDWIQERLKTVTGASVRRELTTIRHMFTIAIERWRYIEKSPMVGVRVPEGNKPRTQRFSEDDIQAILFASSYPERIDTARARTGAAMLFAIETAMRAGEICNLTWEYVNFEKRIAHLPMTKNGTSRDVPLSKAAIQILERLKSELNTEYCFDLKSNILDATFRKLKKMVMREYLHFHDTRREALTRLSRKVDVMTLAKISGHKDISILQNVYYAPRMEDVALLLD
ncbi:tyrosine-type recombinase/integrase [Basfia succiniciproducens]|uniref:tyrosine-type recombinase/integrase n=1 Tax=Basfia succiniciproducens TaxID=653940 RepID=UPI003FCCE8BE